MPLARKRVGPLSRRSWVQIPAGPPHFAKEFGSTESWKAIYQFKSEQILRLMATEEKKQKRKRKKRKQKLVLLEEEEIVSETFPKLLKVLESVALWQGITLGHKGN